MPTYDYECEACGHRFEAFHDMSDSPLSECPQCHGTLRRLVGGGSGIIFKGSGFYATDHAQKGHNHARPRCGQDTPCCGRDIPCDKPSCE